MPRFDRLLAAAVLATAVLAPGAAAAQTTTAPAGEAGPPVPEGTEPLPGAAPPAWMDVLGDLNEDMLTDDQESDLALLAADVAVAAICPGFVIDDARFETAFATFAPADWDDMSEDQRTFWGQQLMVFYGMHVGAAIAEAARDAATTCAIAEAVRNDPTAQTVWQAAAR